MQNSLAVIGDSEWLVLQQQADALVKSGFLPQSIKTPQQAIAIIMLGRELGIPPWASLSTINVIQGKPTVSPQLMLALINRSGQLEDMYIEDDGTRCEVGMVRKGRTSHSFSFSMADAKAMGLDNKDNWKKQPAIMRQWRAVAGCARVVFPDVILGLYTPEEMGADVSVDGEGNMSVIDATTGEITRKDEPPPPRQQNAPTGIVGAGNAIPKADAGAPSSSASTPSGNPTGDAFAKEFPAASKWTPIMLYEAMQDYFDNDFHFREHWKKHEDEYKGLTLQEASALVRVLHWNYDVDKVKALCAWAEAALGMSSKNVADAMGVKRFREWKDGSYAEACDACTVWAEKQAQADLEREAQS
jgi:hypothetical protein